VLEGTLLGLIGAVVALGLLVAVYLFGRDAIVAGAAGLVAVGDVRFLPIGLVLALLGGGGTIGCLGGLMAARTAR
jgi:cell division protein FtsX